jgi:hypothetical protein
MSIKAKQSVDRVEQKVVTFCLDGWHTVYWRQSVYVLTDSTQFPRDHQYTFYHSIILSIVTAIIFKIYNL